MIAITYHDFKLFHGFMSLATAQSAVWLERCEVKCGRLSRFAVPLHDHHAQVRFVEAHGPGGRLSAMAFDASQRRLLTGGSDGVLRFWNANNGSVLREVSTLTRRPESCIASDCLCFGVRCCLQQ